MTISTPLLHQAAAAAAGGQHHPAGALYVVATPIGNLADITLRAVHVLGLVDAVACEDTRVTGQLLRHLGLDKSLIALHQHNEAGAARGVVDRLAQGQRVAYASDAGTPAISDPGAVLVAAVAAAQGQDMTVIALTGRTGGALRGALGETDVLVAVPHDRRVRVLETHLLVLHCLCDAIDLQLLGEQDPA